MLALDCQDLKKIPEFEFFSFPTPRTRRTVGSSSEGNQASKQARKVASKQSSQGKELVVGVLRDGKRLQGKSKEEENEAKRRENKTKQKKTKQKKKRGSERAGGTESSDEAET